MTPGPRSLQQFVAGERQRQREKERGWGEREKQREREREIEIERERERERGENVRNCNADRVNCILAVKLKAFVEQK